METKIRTSITFDPDIIERIEKVRGRFNRSAYVNDALDQMLKVDEERLKIISQ